MQHVDPAQHQQAAPARRSGGAADPDRRPGRAGLPSTPQHRQREQRLPGHLPRRGRQFDCTKTPASSGCSSVPLLLEAVAKLPAGRASLPASVAPAGRRCALAGRRQAPRPPRGSRPSAGDAAAQMQICRLHLAAQTCFTRRYSRQRAAVLVLPVADEAARYRTALAVSLRALGCAAKRLRRADKGTISAAACCASRRAEHARRGDAARRRGSRLAPTGRALAAPPPAPAHGTREHTGKGRRTARSSGPIDATITPRGGEGVGAMLAAAHQRSQLVRSGLLRAARPREDTLG
jgi:hypothetical protein